MPDNLAPIREDPLELAKKAVGASRTALSAAIGLPILLIGVLCLIFVPKINQQAKTIDGQSRAIAAMRADSSNLANRLRAMDTVAVDTRHYTDAAMSVAQNATHRANAAISALAVNASKDTLWMAKTQELTDRFEHFVAVQHNDSAVVDMQLKALNIDLGKAHTDIATLNEKHLNGDPAVAKLEGRVLALEQKGPSKLTTLKTVFDLFTDGAVWPHLLDHKGR